MKAETERFILLIRRITAVVFDVLTLILCLIFIGQLIFDFSSIRMEADGLSVDAGNTNLQYAGIFGLLFTLTVSIAAAVLFTLTAFISKTKWRLRIPSVALLVTVAIAFIIIPPQTYVVSLHVAAKSFGILGCFSFIYLFVITSAVLSLLFGNKKG